MFPNASGSWVILLIACVIGFVIGRWINTRRNKDKTNDEYVNGLKKRILAEKRVPIKKDKKKNRRANKKNITAS